MTRSTLGAAVWNAGASSFHAPCGRHATTVSTTLLRTIASAASGVTTGTVRSLPAPASRSRAGRPADRVRVPGWRAHDHEILGDAHVVHERAQVQPLAVAVERLDGRPRKLVPAAVRVGPLRHTEAPEVARQRGLGHLDAGARQR